MKDVFAHFCRQFYHWERLGRGDLPVSEYPVSLEPPFAPFPGYHRPVPATVDDGSRSTFLTRVADAFRPPVWEEGEGERFRVEFDFHEEQEVVEISVELPADYSPGREASDALLGQLADCKGPVTLEVFGNAETVKVQFAASPDDAEILIGGLRAYFPEAVFVYAEEELISAFKKADPQEVTVLDCGLGREFYFPLAAASIDPFVGLVGALSELSPGEFGMFQVLFQPLAKPWRESVFDTLFDEEELPHPWIAPELAECADEKLKQPLFAVVVRLCSGSGDVVRVWRNMTKMAGPLRLLADPEGNCLIPLENGENYPNERHLQDVFSRQSHRFGMILGQEELLGLVHLPSEEVRSARFHRLTHRTKAAPDALCALATLSLGENRHHGETRKVCLNAEHRARHMHVVGSPGSGKSNLLYEMLCQDIESGQGLALFDPHGDLVNLVLSSVPEERMGDVIVFDPSDENYAPSFNVLSAHSDLERTVLASDLVSVFQEHTSSWGPQMGIIFKSAILAFLSSSRGGTLSDVVDFLINEDFRKAFLESVDDPRIKLYWQSVFSPSKSANSVSAIVGRLSEFLTPRAISDIVAQRKSTLDFSEIMDSGKIFLAKLPLGLFGEGNGHLLAGLLLAKFQQASMGRQMVAEEDRRDFWIYVDECHEFLTPSIHKFLTGTRKYRTGLILAHQNLRQIEVNPEISGAMRNANIRVVFNVDESDAKVLSRGFSSFEAADIQSLDIGSAICAVGRRDHDFNIRVPFRVRPSKEEGSVKRDLVEAASREQYCRPRSEIEEDWLKKLDEVEAVADSKPAGKQVEKTAESKEAESKTKETKPLGKGGPQHRAIVKKIKKLAEEYGCRSIIEKEIAGTGFSIDVMVEGESGTIAFEVWISNDADYELHNVLKCIDAGYSRIVTVCLGRKQILRIRKALEEQDIPEDVEVLQLGYAAEQERLRSLVRELSGRSEPLEESIQVIGGHEIRSKFSNDSPETKALERDAIDLIRKILSQPPPEK